MRQIKPPLTTQRRKNNTRKAIHEFKHESTPDNKPSAASASYSQKKPLPIIQCSCGAEILMLPDLTAMNQAIANHLKEHRKTQNNSKIASEIAAVEQSLIEQLFRLAAERTE